MTQSLLASPMSLFWYSSSCLLSILVNTAWDIGMELEHSWKNKVDELLLYRICIVWNYAGFSFSIGVTLYILLAVKKIFGRICIKICIYLCRKLVDDLHGARPSIPATDMQYIWIIQLGNGDNISVGKFVQPEDIEVVYFEQTETFPVYSNIDLGTEQLQ